MSNIYPYFNYKLCQMKYCDIPRSFSGQHKICGPTASLRSSGGTLGYDYNFDLQKPFFPMLQCDCN